MISTRRLCCTIRLVVAMTAPAVSLPGTSAAAQAPEAGATTPRPPAEVFAPARMPWHPDDLVAVLGDERGKLWSHAGHLLLTPDGRRLIADAGHSSLFIFDADTLAVLATFGDRPTRLLSAALSQDGTRLIAGYADGSMTLWNVAGEQPELEQTVNVMPDNVEQPYLHFAHALRADRVAITVRNKLMLWELQGRRLAEILSFDLDNDLYRPAVSPDGGQVVTKVTIRPAGAIPPERLIGPEGRKIIRFDCRMQLWDVRETPVRELSQLTTAEMQDFVFTPDGQTLIGTSQMLVPPLVAQCVRIIDGQLVQQPDLSFNIALGTTATFSPDGTLMAFMNKSRDLQLMDISTEIWRDVATLETETSYILGVAFNSNASSLYLPIGSCLQRWDRNRHGTFTKVTPAVAHSGLIRDIAFSREGDRLISTGGNTLCEWNVRKLTAPQPVIREVPQVPSGIQQLAAWPERQGVFFHSSGEQNGIQLWDQASGEISETFQIDFGADYRNNAWCFALQPGGNLLATGHWDDAIRFWNLNGTAPRKLAELSKAHSGHVCAVAFSSDGTTLASVGWDHAVKLWDMSTDPPSAARKLGMHDDIVRSVAFSPDGRWLASGDEKGVIRLWNLKSDDLSGSTIRHPEDVARVASPYDQHRTMNTLEFSADGRRLLSADGGGRVTVWTVPTGEIVKRWTFPGWIWAARWSPDQQLIATANQNGTVYLLVAPEP